MPEETNEPNDVQKRFHDLAKDGEAQAIIKHTYEYGDLYDNKDTEQKFLIPDLLPSAQVAVLIGEDGIGKTQIIVQLCLTIAMNLPKFMELPINTETHRALIVATEESKEKFIKASSKQQHAIDPNFDPKKIKIRFTEGADFDSYEHLVIEIEDQCKSVQVLDKDGNIRTFDIIAIDALSDLFTLIDGEINSNTHARKIIQALQAICKNYNTTIVLIHHVPKTKLVDKMKSGKMFLDKTDSQGASAITQKPRTILALTHDPRTLSNDGVTYKNFLHVVKANSMSKTYVKNTLELQFSTNDLLHRFVAMTDRETYEKNQVPSPEQDQRNAIAAAKKEGETKSRLIDFKLMNKGQHDIQLKNIYTEGDTMDRERLVERLRKHYGVGMNKVTEANGLLHSLVNFELLVKVGRSDFRYLNSTYQYIPPPHIPFDEPDVANTTNDENSIPF